MNNHLHTTNGCFYQFKYNKKVVSWRELNCVLIASLSLQGLGDLRHVYKGPSTDI